MLTKTYNKILINEKGGKITMREFGWAFCPVSAFCFFLVCFIGIVYKLPNSAKRRFLSKFESYSITHIFKYYFIIIFLIIIL